MIKSVYDNPQAETIADYYNEPSRQLTAFFFGDGHPFRERMRRKVFDEEIAIRRVRLIPVKMEESPHAAAQEPTIYIHQLLLEVIMKDPALEYDFADEGHHAMQTMYLNARLSQYLNEQCFTCQLRMPTRPSGSCTIWHNISPSSGITSTSLNYSRPPLRNQNEHLYV